MKAKRLKCRRTGKRGWASKEDALGGAMSISKRSDHLWRIYQCEFCNNWHVTTKRDRRVKV